MVLSKTGPFVILCLGFILQNTASAPIGEYETFDFEDDWDYEIKPHNVPVLGSPKAHYQLPALYEYGKHLAIEPIAKGKDDKVGLRKGKTSINILRSPVSCGICKLGLSLFHKEILNGSTFEDLQTKFVSLCVSFKIETEPVCAGFFKVYGPEVVPAVKASKLGPSEICNMVFGETCGVVDNTIHEWDINIPRRERRKLSEADKYLTIRKIRQPMYKVLQLSDTHFDPEYEAGTPANCEEPLCCRNYSTPSDKETNILSGRWGAYQKCDSPKVLIENMLKNIATQHPDIDYILWTGDLPPHDIWNQTKVGNMEIIQATVQQMFQYFPNTPIFPAIGNHESTPAGSFAPPWMRDEKHSIDWLYATITDQWRRWLPSTSGKTVLYGGFYSVLLRPGFRLISLNTNYCHNLNWWLMVNSTDPAKELKWLVHELQAAEDNEEKVHIIGHIPPGSSDCMKTWSKNFYSIVERYEDTIVAQFYGHSHADEFEIFYETKEYSKEVARNMRWRALIYRNKTYLKFTGRPTNVAYLGPSVTTYENHNPAYRIYYIDGDHENSTREVLDHETWTMDLKKANEDDNEPVWFKLYSAKDAYMMSSLRPSEWNRILEKMINYTDTFEQFYRYYYRDSPTRPPCDYECKIRILCDLKSGKSHDRHHLCHDLENI